MLIGVVISLIAVGFLCGLLVNYLADVLPFTRHLSKPVCHHCHTNQSWNEFLGLHRCRNCHSPKSLRYWMVIIIYVTAVSYCYYFPSSRLSFSVGLLLLIYFGIVAVIHIEHRVVLDQISLVGVVLGFAIGFWLLWAAADLTWRNYRFRDHVHFVLYRYIIQSMDCPPAWSGRRRISGIGFWGCKLEWRVGANIRISQVFSQVYYLQS